MKRPNDEVFGRLMLTIEKQVADAWEVDLSYVTASWNGNKIEIVIAKDYELKITN